MDKLPIEIIEVIVGYLECSDRASLCRLNIGWHESIIPIFWACLPLITIHPHYRDLYSYYELFGNGEQSASKRFGLRKFFPSYENRTCTQHRLIVALAHSRISECVLQSVRSLEIIGWVDIGEETRHWFPASAYTCCLVDRRCSP